MMQPGIQEERTEDMTLVALSGEIDLSARDALERTIAAALDRGRPVVVDLSQTTLLDSTILGVLVAGHQEARNRAVDLAMVVGAGQSAVVRNALRITGVDRVIDVHADRDSAHAAVTG